jgi:ADP-ribose pyrophosphatase
LSFALLETHCRVSYAGAMQHDGGWRRQSSRYLFESRWYNLRQDQVALPSGESISYTLVEHPGYAMVVPLLDDGRVILERVYRYTLQQTVLECPSGGLEGQPPEQAARREFEEETGWVAGRMTSLGCFFGSPGISDERFHVFLADRLRETGRVAREATEQIELEIMPLERAFELALTARMLSGPSALAIIVARSACQSGASLRQ